MRLRPGRFEWFEYLLMGCGWALFSAILSLWIGIDLVASGSAFLATVFLFFIPATLIAFSGWIWMRVQKPPLKPDRSISTQIEQLSVQLDQIERKVDETLNRLPPPHKGEGEGDTRRQEAQEAPRESL